MAIRKSVCLMGLLLAFLHSVYSFAAAGLTVTPTGNDTVLLQGLNIKDMSSVEISCGWNTTLGEPRVSVQGGNVAEIVTNANGEMTIKVVRDDPEAVLDIEVGFDNIGDMSRALSRIAVNASDAGGSSHSVPVEYLSLEVPPVWEPPKLQVPPPVSGEARATGRSVKQGHDSAPRKPEEGSARTERISLPDASVTGGQTALDGELQEAAPNFRLSVLQRFREYRGKSGLNEFTDLFVANVVGIRQEPAIAIADGISPVRLSFQLAPREGYAPNFALSDAKFVSLHKEGEKSWIMTIVPNRGACEVGLILRTSSEKIEFPLVVAPPIKIPYGLDDKNFLVELNKYLAAEHAGSAWNNDSSRQYLQQYIFTANYLTRSIIKTSPLLRP